MKKFILPISIVTASLNAFAQEESKIKFSGYLETYYTYDFNKPAGHNRPAFIYSHNRSDEVNVNLGFLKAAYNKGPLRANFALMAGTYANANLATEPGILKNVFEANVGIKLSKTENLWLDAGIFSSHIGFESAISKDCWVLTRNISSENTPYYESGAKITYGTRDGKLTATLLYLNGWQRITRQDGNNKPAGSLQLTWKPNDNITLNYSNYLGKETVDTTQVTRFYHNIYGVFQLTNKIGLTLGIDYGTQQKTNAQPGKNQVFSPVAIARYKFTDQWAVAGRFEYYKDPNGLFIETNTPHGFKTKGYSLNIDYAPISNAVIRLEGKIYDADEKVFSRNGNPVSNNASITASMAIAF